MSITIRKIAKDLNLAVSTVSKALRDSYEISDETKQQVLKYAREHNYVPNAYAGSLKNRKSKNIAVVLPEVADTYFSNAINGIDSIATQKGYHVIVYLTHESPERELEILQELRGGRVDGVLISVSAGVAKDSEAHRELATKMPMVFFDRVCQDVEAAKVLTDDFQAAYLATTHLLDKGCKSILFLCAGMNLSIMEMRRGGFQKALEDRHQHPGDHHILITHQDESESKTMIRDFLKSHPAVDAVIGSVEKVALQVYEICQEDGILIPGQLRVIAFSNLRIAGLLSPSLSTIRQPAYDMGKAAAEILFKALGKKVKIEKEVVVLPSVLCEGKSTS